MIAPLLTLLFTVGASGSIPTAEVPPTIDADAIRATIVQHDGRWMPLDTLARDLVREITGEDAWQGADPVVTLLAWTFDAAPWSSSPLVPIGNAELRRELELPADRSRFSFEELVRHGPLMELIGSLSTIQGRKLDPLESKVSQINGRLLAMQDVFRGDAIKLVPHPADANAAWRGADSLEGSAGAGPAEARAAWMALGGAFLSDDAAAFEEAAEELIETLATLPAAYRPTAEIVAVELRYNALRPFRVAWWVMAFGALLGGIALAVRRRAFDAVVFTTLLVGFGLLSWGLWMRGTIAGRLPAANMFESLLFLSWGTGAFAIITSLFVRNRGVPLTASAMGALALCLADSLPMDQFIRPIAPVLLDTFWMSVHVPVIMVSYSVLTLAVLVAHVQVCSRAVKPRDEKFSEAIDRVHAWYMHAGAILLFVGIVTGSMWAASSWGRYWGWDPKEVWSLIAFLGYMVIMHVRVSAERVSPLERVGAGVLGIVLLLFTLGKLGDPSIPKALAGLAVLGAMTFFVVGRGALATAVKSILAFWMVIMTYVGVNYVLGIGLHSYGFGTGAIAGRVFLIGSIDLAFVALCVLVHVVRRRKVPSGSPA